MVLCLLAGTGADGALAGVDDRCRSRGGSHAYSHYGSLGTIDGGSHRRDGVWRIVHSASCRWNRTHPFSRPADCAGQKFPSAYYWSCYNLDRQKDLAMEIINRISMYKILFLHGFFASGQCVPAEALRDAFKGRAEVITPDLPMHPKEAINFIRELIEKEKPVAGRSMRRCWLLKWAFRPCSAIRISR